MQKDKGGVKLAGVSVNDRRLYERHPQLYEYISKIISLSLFLKEPSFISIDAYLILDYLVSMIFFISDTACSLMCVGTDYWIIVVFSHI